MTRVQWTDPTTRLFETGLDRGVLYPRSSTAVAWNGLTSVDEAGAEESVSYYLEGRPFLVVPKPKEYEASLKAYTYPDEFAPMMGLLEATDGMYLGSQQSNVFDLSYRTLIGNATEGTSFGYKIHLIYNATVDDQGTSYASLNDSVNPNELSWNIKTVPVKLDGFRPTAHIIIDSRHLSKDKLEEIESLLYGTSSSSPSSLPDPQVLYDAMNFGDDVVIVDNGDGTWTATGSYRNVIVNSDGSFVINNVDAVNNPDGSWYIGDSPIDAPTGSDGGTPSSVDDIELDGGSPTASGDITYDGGSPTSSGGEDPDPTTPAGLTAFITEPLRD